MVNIGTAYSNITELYKYYHAVAYVFLVISDNEQHEATDF
jgi:hypothetical protein